MAPRRAGWWSWSCVALLAAAACPLAAARETAVPARAVRPPRTLKASEVQLVELGRRLFFDPALSAFGERSCASCHDPNHGFSDRSVRSVDDPGLTPRHSQSLIDLDFSMRMHWDGSLPDLVTITRGRMGSSTVGSGYDGRGVTLATPFVDVLAAASAGVSRAVRDLGPGVVVSRSGTFPPATVVGFPGSTRIRERYDHVLGTHRRLEEADDVCSAAIAAYIGTLRSDTSAFDRFDAGDGGAFTDSQRRGLELFRGRAGCAECHSLDKADGWWPAFRDGNFHNTGVAWIGRAKVEFAALVPDLALAGDQRSAIEKELKLREGGDPGRGAIAEGTGLLRAFKTPTLRDVARHPPFMHDGSFDTLEEVVRHYARGCGDDDARDARLRGFQASETDVADLVAFLNALTSERRPGRADAAWARRVRRTALKFVDGEDRPLAGLTVTFTPAGDLATPEEAVATPFTRVADEHGQIGIGPTPFTHVRMTLPHGVAAVGGAWIPDSLTTAKIVVPVRGTARVTLVLPQGVEAPETLSLWRSSGPAFEVAEPGPGAQTRFRTVLPVNPEPWSFAREGVVDVGGRRAALYGGWCPNVGRDMLFRLDGQRSPQKVTLEPDTTVRVDVHP